MAKKSYTKLINNWKVVLFSVMGATTFWFFNALNKDYSALIKYPIEFVMDKDSVVIIEPLPTDIEIDVSSGGWNIFRQTLLISVSPILLELDNPSEIRYLTRSTLYPLVVDHFSDLSINYLLTDTLKINVERKMYKGVKLKIDSANIPLADGFRIISPIHLFPDTALISGPESVINYLESEYYLSVSETQLNADFVATVEVALPFEEFMSAIPETVTVSFKVDRFEMGRIQVPVEKVNFPLDQFIDLKDSVITISYLVQRSNKERVKPAQFNVTVDYKLMQPDSTITPIVIFYPEEVTEVSLITKTLAVVNNARKL